VLAANHQWAVDSGGAGLVGWVVIDVVRLLTISIRNDNVVVVIVPHQSVLHGYHVAFSYVAWLEVFTLPLVFCPESGWSPGIPPD